MLNLVLCGPPGAGKGTQSVKLIQKYALIHLSTGDILRAEIANSTPLGLEAKKLMDQGLLVPDAVVIGMISSKLDANRNAKGFIFDGFPRTTAQAQALDILLAEKNTSISRMLALPPGSREATGAGSWPPSGSTPQAASTSVELASKDASDARGAGMRTNVFR